MDQRVSRVRDLGRAEALLRPLGRPVRAARARRPAASSDEPELVAASDSVCTGLQLVNFLQDVPRDLELGRIYLPAEDRRALRRSARSTGRPTELRALLAVRGAARRGAPRRRRGAARAASAGGSAGRSRSSPAAGWRRSTRSRRPAGTSSRSGRSRRAPRLAREAALVLVPMSTSTRAYARGRSRITRREAKNFAYGIMVLPRDKRRAIAAIYAFARRVDDIADGAAAGGARSASRLEELRARARRDAGAQTRSCRARRRARALRHPARARCGARRRAACRTRPAALRRLRRAARLLREGRRRGRRSRASRSTALATRSARDLRRDAGHRAPADQHHPRRRRGPAARPGLPPAGRARPRSASSDLARRRRSFGS